MTTRHCYCVEDNTCDFCNGYRSVLCPELHCPRATKIVAAVLGVSTTELVHMAAKDVRSAAPSECAALRIEVSERYPSCVEDFRRQGLWVD